MATVPAEHRKFLNEVARTAAEALTRLKAEYDLSMASGAISRFENFLNDLPSSEVLDDGRAAEGVAQLTKAEALAALTLIGQLNTAVNGDPAGIGALAKLRVRPLTVG